MLCITVIHNNCKYARKSVVSLISFIFCKYQFSWPSQSITDYDMPLKVKLNEFVIVRDICIKFDVWMHSE